MEAQKILFAFSGVSFAADFGGMNFLNEIIGLSRHDGKPKPLNRAPPKQKFPVWIGHLGYGATPEKILPQLFT